MDEEIVKLYNKGRVTSRQIDELIGICKGSLADGHVCEAEARYLLQWIEANRDCAGEWPANVIYIRLAEMLRDNTLDDDESGELLGLLLQLTGGSPNKAGNKSTNLPLTDPAPDIIFNGRTFCATGTFSYGNRARVRSTIEALGGENLPGVRKNLDYLVIGSIGSQTWKHSSFGEKITSAMEYQRKGCPIMIVSEEHWLSFLP